MGDAARDPAVDPAGEVRAALEVLLGADLAACGFGELDVLRGASQRLRGFAAAADVRIARRSQELCGALGSGFGPDGSTGPRPGAGAGEGPGDDDNDGAAANDDAAADANGAADGDGDGDGEDGTDGDGVGTGGRVGDGSAFGNTTDRRSGVETERDHQRSRAIALMPSFETALAAGRIDLAHLDALVAALGRIDDDEVRRRFVGREGDLLGHATVETPERFRRRCHDLARQLLRAHGVELAARQRRAARARQWWDRRSGMFHLHLEVEPELGAKIETALEEHLATVRERGSGEPWERLRVDAVAELLTHSGALSLRSPEVVVLVDWDTLRTGVLAAGGVCESHGGGELAPATVRRLACDAGILPLVLGGDGVPLDAGRTRRLATREQRRALRAMYRTCAHPECDRPFSWCRIHHVVPWELLGPSDLDVLIPLCDRHHHQVHEGEWTLTMTSDRICTWTTPSGRVWFHGDTRDALGPDHCEVADDREVLDHRAVAGHGEPGVVGTDRCGRSRSGDGCPRSDRAAAPATASFPHDTEPSGP